MYNCAEIIFVLWFVIFIEPFSDNKEMLENYNDGKLESFLESYNENIFNRLDDDFSIEEVKFDSLLETYIRKYESSFGD